MACGMPQTVKGTLGRPDAAFNHSMELIERGTADGSIVVIAPSDPSRLVGRTTFDAARLRDCAAMAHDDVRAAFSSGVR